MVDKSTAMNKRQVLINLVRDFIGVIGVTTAMITIVLGVRSVYGYFSERTETAATLNSWLHVAEIFESSGRIYPNIVDSLDVTIYALEQAQALDPRNEEIERKLFLADSRQAYLHLNTIAFAIDYWREYLPNMSTRGHIALKKTDDPVEKARILVHLAGIEEWLTLRDDKVNELLERAHALDPDNTEALYRIAEHILENDNKDEKALNLLTRAVHLAPNDALYLYNLGSLYMDLEQTETGKKYFKRAANTDVSAQDALRKRAQTRADSLVWD